MRISSCVNLGDMLRLPSFGERGAIIDLHDAENPVCLTAFELDALCCAVGRGLERRGLRPGARVGILAENRHEFLACYFGIMRLGAVAVPVNHRLPQATVDHIFKDSEIDFAFCDAGHRDMVPQGVPLVDFDRDDDAGFRSFLNAGELATFVPRGAELAEILYTSGSTGLPKGVPLDHAGQVWAHEHYLTPLEGGAQPRTILVAPLYHMNGLFNITVSLAQRALVIMLPRFDARRFLETAAAYECTMLSGIPTMFALMVRERDLTRRLDFSRVRDVTIGSAPLTDALLSQVNALFPNAAIKNGYGTTEAGPAVFGPHPDGRPRPSLSLGFPFADVECRLLDESGPDQGVLEVRTKALMQGYLNLPKATASRVRDGWYMTGDVMRRDAEGFYYFVGRCDDMFVCGGENVYPGEVEKLLERHPQVAQAIVVAAPDDIKGQIPVAFVVKRTGTVLNAEELKQYALREGAAFAHPRFIEFVDTLPVSGTHKIDRTALTARAADLSRSAGRSS